MDNKIYITVCYPSEQAEKYVIGPDVEIKIKKNRKAKKKFSLAEKISLDVPYTMRITPDFKIDEDYDLVSRANMAGLNQNHVKDLLSIVYFSMLNNFPTEFLSPANDEIPFIDDVLMSQHWEDEARNTIKELMILYDMLENGTGNNKLVFYNNKKRSKYGQVTLPVEGDSLEWLKATADKKYSHLINYLFHVNHTLADWKDVMSMDEEEKLEPSPTFQYFYKVHARFCKSPDETKKALKQSFVRELVVSLEEYIKGVSEKNKYGKMEMHYRRLIYTLFINTGLIEDKDLSKISDNESKTEQIRYLLEKGQGKR